jgi:hypothetical protein
VKRSHFKLAIGVLLTAAIFAVAQKIEPQGRVELNPPTFPQTYTAGTQNITAATTPTDIYTLTGSSTKTIRITRFMFWATQTSGNVATVTLVRRSSANSGGTCTADGANPYDTNNAAATATACHYTVNPTSTGTLAGTLRNYRPLIPTATQNPTGYIWEDFGDSTQPIVLRGTSDILAVNLGGATISGLSYTIQVEWTEQ